ncbi:hypothetical protein [Oenococcus oeni]|uniref:hypothetical protein n=1 Tax=Oenococcus oeni TaxID=1247 RepID=UPI0010BB21EC|nr:hypothetical protein [Oenococcus oeni]SYW19463.1 hypothetical protein OENI_160011 [Oenococcus oeni]
MKEVFVLKNTKEINHFANAFSPKNINRADSSERISKASRVFAKALKNNPFGPNRK